MAASEREFVEVPSRTTPTPIKLVGIEIPIGDLVILWIKVALAAIPALLILALSGAVIFGFLTALVGLISK